MANNRIYLKCRCGSERFLAKRFIDGYYTMNHAALDEWFDEHKYCGGTQDNFEMVYECRRDWDSIPDNQGASRGNDG